MEVVSIIIINDENQVLLQLRDDKPSIPFPNKWVTLGGSVEQGESPEEAIKRELKEEIEFKLVNFELFKSYEWPDRVEFVFQAKFNFNLETVPLHEGQRIGYFSWKQIQEMNLAFNDDEIFRDYFNNKINQTTTLS
jgi:8-oxo-dGTP diphosphatase